MSRVQAHVHKLKRYKYKSTGTAVYFCTLPDCAYKTDTKLTLGKRSICWRCGHEFLINEYSIRLSKPHCMDCKKTKGMINIPEIEPKVNNTSSDNLKDRLSRTINQFSREEEI
jgi:hypothetical protein